MVQVLVYLPGLCVHRAETPYVKWRDYNQRAKLEQRINEPESDLVADDF